MMPVITANAQKQLRSGNERRTHPRVSYLASIRFSELASDPPKAFYAGKVKNLSRGGMKISALAPLERRSIILVDLDLKTILEMIRTKQILSISDRRILAEVAWRHLNLQTGLFEAGLRFLEPRDRTEYECAIAQAARL
jgi:hypothetical protein